VWEVRITWPGALGTTLGVTCRFRLRPPPVPDTRYRLPPIRTSFPGGFLAPATLPDPTPGLATNRNCWGLAADRCWASLAVTGAGVRIALFAIPLCHWNAPPGLYPLAPTPLCHCSDPSAPRCRCAAPGGDALWNPLRGWGLKREDFGGELAATPTPRRTHWREGCPGLGLLAAATVRAAAKTMLGRLTRLCLLLWTREASGRIVATLTIASAQGLLAGVCAGCRCTGLGPPAPPGETLSSWFGRFLA